MAVYYSEVCLSPPPSFGAATSLSPSACPSSSSSSSAFPGFYAKLGGGKGTIASSSFPLAYVHAKAGGGGAPTSFSSKMACQGAHGRLHTLYNLTGLCTVYTVLLREE